MKTKSKQEWQIELNSKKKKKTHMKITYMKMKCIDPV